MWVSMRPAWLEKLDKVALDTAQDRRDPQRVLNTAQKIIGTHLLSISDIIKVLDAR